MTDKTDLPKVIYLIPDGDGYVWCEDPAPGVGMEEKDAVAYLRSDNLALYEATNKLMARLGAEGGYHPDMDEVSDVMNALHDIDGGVYNPPIDNKDDLMTAIRAKEDAEERLRVVDAVYMMAAEALPHDMRTLFNNEAIKNAKGKEHILNMSSDAFIEQACEALDEHYDPVYDEAVNIATFICEEYYKDVASEWEPLDNVSGVISQIDNMVAGLPQRFIERNTSIREAIRSLERNRVVIEVLGIIDFIPEFSGPSIPTYKDAIKQAIRDRFKGEKFSE